MARCHPVNRQPTSPPTRPAFNPFLPIHMVLKPLSLFWTLRLHSEQAGRPADATLWERLHRDQRGGGPHGGRRALQIPLRKAQDVRRRRNTKPLPWLRGSRGRDGELKGRVRGALLSSHKNRTSVKKCDTSTQCCWLILKRRDLTCWYSKHLEKAQKRYLHLCFVDWWYFWGNERTFAQFCPLRTLILTLSLLPSVFPASLPPPGVRPPLGSKAGGVCPALLPVS